MVVVLQGVESDRLVTRRHGRFQHRVRLLDRQVLDRRGLRLLGINQSRAEKQRQDDGGREAQRSIGTLEARRKERLLHKVKKLRRALSLVGVVVGPLSNGPVET